MLSGHKAIHIPLASMQPWTWPERPWQRVHVDFAGLVSGKMCFLLMDAHSKWPEVYEMTSTTAQMTIEILRHIFASYGLPEQLVSDNGPQFVAKEFEEFMLNNGIKHIRSAPYHPATNGLSGTFRAVIQKSDGSNEENSGQTWQHRLSSFLLAYRSTPHTVTNVSPGSLFLQRELRTRLDLLRETTEQIVQKKQEEQKEWHDKSTRERGFEPNNVVWARNVGAGERWIKGQIKQGSGPASYMLADGRMWRRHTDHLRRAEERIKKSGGRESDKDDEQMTQSTKEEEKRTVLEEREAVQIEQDTPEGENETEKETGEREEITENETDERGEIYRKPEVEVTRHKYQLRQNRRPPDRY